MSVSTFSGNSLITFQQSSIACVTSSLVASFQKELEDLKEKYQAKLELIEALNLACQIQADENLALKEEEKTQNEHIKDLKLICQNEAEKHDALKQENEAQAHEIKALKRYISQLEEEIKMFTRENSDLKQLIISKLQNLESKEEQKEKFSDALLYNTETQGKHGNVQLENLDEKIEGDNKKSIARNNDRQPKLRKKANRAAARDVDKVNIIKNSNEALDFKQDFFENKIISDNNQMVRQEKDPALFQEQMRIISEQAKLDAKVMEQDQIQMDAAMLTSNLYKSERETASESKPSLQDKFMCKKLKSYNRAETDKAKNKSTKWDTINRLIKDSRHRKICMKSSTKILENSVPTISS